MEGRPKRGPKFDKPLQTTEEQVASPVPGNLDRRTSVVWENQTIVIDPENIEVIEQLGRGAYGIVERVRHSSGFEMAVKRITAVSQEQRRLLMDMDVLVKGMACPQIVKFYGALFSEGDLWIFMEILDASLDKFYKLFYKNRKDLEIIPEDILGKVAASVVKALHYLHSIKIIHRDVKPSNILINKKGEVKLCDFGIAGYLVNSIAQTFEAGCRPYMAPERINPSKERQGYDIRSDVWSLGISMVEQATGKFPYPNAGNFFEQLKRVCTDDPPRLPPGLYSTSFEDFVVQCLQKDYEKRPNYATLMEHQFVTTYADSNISEFVSSVLENDNN